jgi:hypothetical protein
MMGLSGEMPLFGAPGAFGAKLGSLRWSNLGAMVSHRREAFEEAKAGIGLNIESLYRMFGICQADVQDVQRGQRPHKGNAFIRETAILDFGLRILDLRT